MTEQTIDRNIQITEELLCSAKAGDRDALTALYEGTHQEIYRTIHAMVRDEDLTMDIQQDTYIHAFTHLDQLRNTSSFLPWLRRIAVNEAKMQLRKKKPMLFTEYVAVEGEVPEIPDEKPESSPELALDRKETSRLVSGILDELSDLQRMLVGMYYYEEIPLNQIAEDLNINQSTARSLLSRSRKKIEAAVRNLEKKGIRLYGLAPIPFLVSLLRQSEPAAKMSGEALPEILSASGITKAAAVHVGRRFLETALGKVLIGVLAAGVVSGGVMGYRYWKDQDEKAKKDNIRLDVQETETWDTAPDTMQTDPETGEDLIVPDKPPTAQGETEAPGMDTPEDLTPEESPAASTEPESADPVPIQPPEPTNPAQPDPASPTPTEAGPTEAETLPADTAEDLTPEPSEVDTPEDFVIPTEPETTESVENDPEQIEPRVISCCWNKYANENEPERDTIYDLEWNRSEFIQIEREAGALPTITTDRPDVVLIPEEWSEERVISDPQTTYLAPVTSIGPGTAHIYCQFNGELIRTLTVENPEYPETVLRTELTIFPPYPYWDDPSYYEPENCILESDATWYLFVQGWTAPQMTSDNPDVLTVYLYSELSGPDTSWIIKEYCWNAKSKKTGTANVTLWLNGEAVQTWTFHVIDPPEISDEETETTGP